MMAKVSSVPRTSATSPGRLAAGVRNVASVKDGPVEEMSPETGVALDDAALPYQEGMSGAGEHRDRKPTDSHGVFMPPGKTFAAMFELQQTTERRSGGPRSGKTIFAELRAKAINTYLTNSDVIHGKKDVPGDSVSLKL